MPPASAGPAAGEPAFRDVFAHTVKPNQKKNVVIRGLEASFGCVLHGEYASNEIRTAKYTLVSSCPASGWLSALGPLGKRRPGYADQARGAPLDWNCMAT